MQLLSDVSQGETVTLPLTSSPLNPGPLTSFHQLSVAFTAVLPVLLMPYVLLRRKLLSWMTGAALLTTVTP